MAGAPDAGLLFSEYDCLKAKYPFHPISELSQEGIQALCVCVALSKSMWSLLPWVSLTQGFIATFRGSEGCERGLFPADVPLATSFHSLFYCFDKSFKEGAVDRCEVCFTWLEHPLSAQGSSGYLARMGHVEKMLLTGSTRFKSLGGAILLEGAVRSVKLTLEMDLGSIQCGCCQRCCSAGR